MTDPDPDPADVLAALPLAAAKLREDRELRELLASLSFAELKHLQITSRAVTHLDGVSCDGHPTCTCDRLFELAGRLQAGDPPVYWPQSTIRRDPDVRDLLRLAGHPDIADTLDGAGRPIA